VVVGLLLENSELLKQDLKCQEGSQNGDLTPGDLKYCAERR